MADRGRPWPRYALHEPPSGPSTDIAIEKVRELVQKIRRQGCLCLPKLELLPCLDDNTVVLTAIHEDGCPAKVEDGA